MDKIIISTYLPMAMAAELGVTNYGELGVETSQEQWQSTTTEIRNHLVGGAFYDTAGEWTGTRLHVQAWVA